MSIIEIKSLSKYYGNVRGIHDINLCVEQGEFFWFIGPNGSGKSTAIRTILGLIKPTNFARAKAWSHISARLVNSNWRYDC